MAVYTEVSDIELKEFIDRYDIGGLTSCKGIAEGVENSNYLVHTETDAFILTLYEKRVDPADLPFFLNLLEHLAAKDFVCPLPVKDRNGIALQTLAGRPAALMSFLEGMWIRRPDTRHCQALGAALAQMHIATMDFQMERPNALDRASWRGLVEDCGHAANTVHAGLYEDLFVEVEALEAVWPRDLPRGVIHADLFPDNVFFLADRLSGFIDFYFACTDAYAYDIAICLNAWCFEPDGSFNVTKARGLLSAYRDVRTLSTEEYAALPVLSRGASLRFLLTRLYDWLNTPEGALVKPKDPMEYVRKLRFHRTVSGAQEYGLDP